MPYDYTAIEARWQAYWDEHKTFRVEIDREKPKYYVLDMFPYPSGDGLHVGHPEGYTATDIVARYKRMRGFNVLHPMGWDAFGLPAERYAMKTGTHPATRTAECVNNFRRQLKTLGFSYDWDREVDTTDPKYYRWTQWIFLRLWSSWYDHTQQKARSIDELPIPSEVQTAGEVAVRSYQDEHRLAYLTEAPVNWCPDLRVVLANEEVEEQVAAGHEVIRKPMKQWMLRITKYAERLLDDLAQVEWPSSTLTKQQNWIGRSEGAEVDFRIDGLEGDEGLLRVFTTRPDTLYGATYMVMAPEHPAVASITAQAQRAAVEAYVSAAAKRSDRDRQAASADGDKTGAFTGGFAINPVNGEKIPIWISDYVLMGYGTGAIMAVPAHDLRDHAFATTFGLPIIQVVKGGDHPVAEEAFVGVGEAVNSPVIDGLQTDAAKEKIIAHLEAQGLGVAKVTYKLRDWLFSRQRYWGEPFPLVHEADGRVSPVEEARLPVVLPPMEDFNPSETGEPPLAKAEEWRNLADGALRETNTMPQWAGSCWYYLRFLDPDNAAQGWSREAESYWMPVDLYVGGDEHAVLHLLYARFWHKVLFDLGYVSTPEPFKRLVHQGMVLGATFFPKDRRRDDDGKPISYKPDEVEQEGDHFVHKQSREALELQWDKMSKSRGNVVNPDDVIQRYGADTMRLYEMFMGPLEHSAPWQPEGVVGCHKFLQRAYRLFFDSPKEGDDVARTLEPGEGTDRQRRLLHQTIAAVSERVDRMGFNTAISAMMVFVRDIEKAGEALHKDAACQFCLLLAPFAPHLAEECWRALGYADSLAYEPWPAPDDAFLQDETWTLVLQVNGKRRGELAIPASVDPKSKDEVLALARADEAVQRYVGENEPKRVIYVPGKLVNIVV